MVMLLYFAPFDVSLKAGSLIFSLCAGAPILIKLTQTAEQKVSLVSDSRGRDITIKERKEGDQ
jgi:hypothetical protein